MDHISPDQLRSFAAYDIRFTDDENDHLKHCRECFNRWSEFIRQVPQSVAERFPRLEFRGV